MPKLGDYDFTVRGQILKIPNKWLHIRILHPQISLNTNFGVSSISNWVDLNLDPYLPKLGDYDVTVRGQILKIPNKWLHIRILHPQISLNTNFGVSSISNWVDLNLDPYLPKLGYCDVTVRGQILKIPKNWFHISILHPPMSQNLNFGVSSISNWVDLKLFLLGLN